MKSAEEAIKSYLAQHPGSQVVSASVLSQRGRPKAMVVMQVVRDDELSGRPFTAYVMIDKEPG